MLHCLKRLTFKSIDRAGLPARCTTVSHFSACAGSMQRGDPGTAERLGSQCMTPLSQCAGSMRREDLGIPEGPGSQCMTACSRDGCVVEVVPVSEEDWCVLAAVQGAMRRDHLTAPLSWAEHGRIRHWTGVEKQGEPPPYWNSHAFSIDQCVTPRD